MKDLRVGPGWRTYWPVARDITSKGVSGSIAISPSSFLLFLSHEVKGFLMY